MNTTRLHTRQSRWPSPLTLLGLAFILGCGGGGGAIIPKSNPAPLAPTPNPPAPSPPSPNPPAPTPPAPDPPNNPLPAAPDQVTAVPTALRSLTVQWQDNASNEQGYKVYLDTVPVNTLPANTTSATLDGLDPDRAYTVQVVAYNAKGESPAPSVTATTLHSQPATWSTCKIHAFSNESGGPADSYWMRSSSMNNAGGVFSSPLSLTRATGDVKNGDSFYVGCRGRWKMWILESTHYHAGKMEDPETFTYDSYGSASIYLYNPDGSVKKHFTSGHATLVISWKNGEYRLSAMYQPTTPDPSLPSDQWLCQDVPLSGTETRMLYQ